MQEEEPTCPAGSSLSQNSERQNPALIDEPTCPAGSSLSQNSERQNPSLEDIMVTRSSMPPYEVFIKAIKPLWDSHWLTNMGKYHQELEKRLEAYLCVPRVSLMVNGHMALELAIQAFHFPEGSEVITTPFTFVSTTHAIIRNHLRPVFCDVKYSNGTMDPDRIEELITDKTVAILPVHVYGYPCDTESIRRVAEKYRLKVIYDAAHAFGVKYKGAGIGSYGDASIFSFHATKVYNTIEGGAVACSDSLYEKMYDLKNFGIRDEEHVASIGANAKMNEFSAIMGLCNLEYLEEELRLRGEIDRIYREEFHGLVEKGLLTLFSIPEETKRNYAYFPVLFQNEAVRDRVCGKLRKQGIYPRKYFYPITADQECFGNAYQDASLACARELSSRVLTLPIYASLKKEQLIRVINAVKAELMAVQSQ